MIQRYRDEQAEVVKKYREEIAVLTAQRDMATKDVEDLIKERRTLLDERDAHQKEIAKKEEEIAALKAELKEQFEQGISIIHDQGAENILLKEQIATLKIFIAGLKSLVDGASDVVEIWAAESPAQKVWKAEWLAKAREALK